MHAPRSIPKQAPPLTPLDTWTARQLGVDRLTREALDVWHLRQIDRLVASAQDRSPFYRELYGTRHLVPLGCAADLAALPFVTQTDIRERGLDMLCVSHSDVARVVTLPTSGTTGPPKRVWFTEADMALTVDFFHHGMQAIVEPGDRLLVLMPGPQPGTVGTLMAAAMEPLGVETVVYGFVDDPAKVNRLIVERRIDSLIGVPAQVLALARDGALPRPAFGSLKSVLLSADHVPVAVRRALEETWGCAVFEHYGSTELGLGGAVQCRTLAGLHIREADVLVEVIDPESGRPLPDGAVGELVVTTLRREAMPFIRYRTGDLGRLEADPCPCGSALRCLGRVRERLGDAVDLGPAGRLTMADLDEAVYPLPWVIGFSAEVSDGLRLRLDVTASAATPADAARLVAARAEALPVVARSGLTVDASVARGPATPGGAAKRRIKQAERSRPARR